MDTEFRFLDQLERDLHDAAVREQALEAAPIRRPPKRRRSGGGSGHRWGSIAAVLVGLLVLAGAIGGLSQLGHNELSTGATGALEPESAGGGGSDTGAVTNPPAGVSMAPGVDRSRRTALWSADTSADGSVHYNFDSLQGAATGAGEAGSGQAAAEQPQIRQDLSKIIRDGTITVVVPQGDFGTSFDQATAIAEQAGGFVLSSSISQENQGTLTLRIPSSKLDGAVVKLRALGRLANLTLSGQDVTSDYIDLKSRLGVMKTQRDLILRLLNESTTVSGQLSLSNRYADIQTQIERLQGTLNVLNDKVSLATLKVTLREEGVATPDAPDEVTHPTLGSAWDHAVQGFFGVVAAVVVGLGYLIPLLVLAGLVLLIRRAVIRRRAPS
jgi:hypothetical protein